MSWFIYGVYGFKRKKSEVRNMAQYALDSQQKIRGHFIAPHVTFVITYITLGLTSSNQSYITSEYFVFEL
jgi:hypothetical protein